MSDEEMRKGMTEDDDVEAHRSKVSAADEAADEMRKGTDDDDDVEAHRHSKLNAPKKA